MNKTSILIVAVFVVLVGGVLFYMNADEMARQDSEEIPFESTDREELSDTEISEEIITNQDEITMVQATLKTSKGDITLEFYPELAPETVSNFQKLAESEFYNGVIFHRVIKDFMIQGGDPTGTGRGGPGYKFNDEFDPSSEIAQRGYVRGTLAMANSGPNTNGSQFFIMHKDYPLPYDYTIFGRVVEGMDVVDAIATTQTGANDRPVEDIVINEVVVLTE